MKITSEMAGTVLEIKVKQGEVVCSGNEVCVLESMKMEVPVISQVAGKIKTIFFKVGDFVNEGDALFELE